MTINYRLSLGLVISLQKSRFCFDKSIWCNISKENEDEQFEIQWFLYANYPVFIYWLYLCVKEYYAYTHFSITSLHLNTAIT